MTSDWNGTVTFSDIVMFTSLCSNNIHMFCCSLEDLLLGQMCFLLHNISDFLLLLLLFLLQINLSRQRFFIDILHPFVVIG